MVDGWNLKDPNEYGLFYDEVQGFLSIFFIKYSGIKRGSRYYTHIKLQTAYFKNRFERQKLMQQWRRKYHSQYSVERYYFKIVVFDDTKQDEPLYDIIQ